MASSRVKSYLPLVRSMSRHETPTSHSRIVPTVVSGQPLRPIGLESCTPKKFGGTDPGGVTGRGAGAGASTTRRVAGPADSSARWEKTLPATVAG